MKFFAYSQSTSTSRMDREGFEVKRWCMGSWGSLCRLIVSGVGFWPVVCCGWWVEEVLACCGEGTGIFLCCWCKRVGDGRLWRSGINCWEWIAGICLHLSDHIRFSTAQLSLCSFQWFLSCSVGRTPWLHPLAKGWLFVVFLQESLT